MWGTPAALSLAAAAIVFRDLRLAPTGASNAIVDWGIALAAFPLAVLGLGCAFAASRWALAACWPAPLGIVADATALTFRLGPFGNRAYDAARLDVKYLFELSSDGEDEGYEAFLPEEAQRSSLLPRIVHPFARERLDRSILKYADGDESAAAIALRPILDHWRRTSDANPDTSNRESANPDLAKRDDGLSDP